jgi:hypothetical protein
MADNQANYLELHAAILAQSRHEVCFSMRTCRVCVSERKVKPAGRYRRFQRCAAGSTGPALGVNPSSLQLHEKQNEK